MNTSSSEPVFHIRSRTTAATNARTPQQIHNKYEVSACSISRNIHTYISDNNLIFIRQSLDYEVCENTLFQEEQRKRKRDRYSLRTHIIRWIIFILIGIITALIACTINIVIEELSELKYKFLKACMY